MTWNRLGNEYCKHPCVCGTKVRIHSKYQDFLVLLEEKAGLAPEQRPTDIVLTYKCPWCSLVRGFTHEDIVLGTRADKHPVLTIKD